VEPSQKRRADAERVLVYGNSAKFGGGIYNEGTLTATNSTISTNIATATTSGNARSGEGLRVVAGSTTTALRATPQEA
jgi:hypothetical protein